MKSNSTILSPVFGLLIGTICLSGDSLQYTMTDGAGTHFASCYAFGDVVNGVVVMDMDSGAFSVVLNAAGSGFLSPVQFSINHNLNKLNTFPANGLFAAWKPGQTPLTKPLIQSTNDLSVTVNSPNPDTDGDGIEDESDHWNNSNTNEFVELLGIDTGILNRTIESDSAPTGHTLADVIQLLELAASQDAKFHRQYVQELVRSYKMLVKDDLITHQEQEVLMGIVAMKRQ